MNDLLQRRLIVVTGKGGTGKTSVVGALALAAARSGRRVLVAETGRDEHLPRLLAPGTPPVGYAGRELAPGLHVLRIDPYQALAEYLGLQLGMRAVVSRVLGNRGFRQLLDAAPGWRELITLGKVWHLAQEQAPDGTPRHQLLLVDAPATGHGLTFLDVPNVVGNAVRAGPLRRNAEMVGGMLRDPEHSLLLPVALAEELPARETEELVSRVRSELSVPIDRVVVNMFVEDPFPPELPDLDTRLARLPADLHAPGLPTVPRIARSARYLRARHELNRRYLREIEQVTALPSVVLPLLPGGIDGPDGLLALADRLLAPAAAEAA